MTEAEWLTLTDVTPLPWEFAKHLSERKFLLCAVAACRTVEHLLDEEGRWALRVAERHVEGAASTEECDAAQAVVTARIPGLGLSAYGAVGWTFASYPPVSCMQYACLNAIGAGGQPASAYADILRDVFGNPFRAVVFDHQWLTIAVTKLAETIYEEGAFAPMPELADALAAAGCTDADVLAHCRGPGPHVRGCWVVDLILGKAR